MQVADASNLATLAKQLRDRGLDPTEAEIRTTHSEPLVTMTGLRTRAAARSGCVQVDRSQRHPLR